MNEEAPPATPDPTPAPTETKPKKRHHVRLWIFCGMLGLALVAMAGTMSQETGAWELWIALLVVYGGTSIVWTWQRAKRDGRPRWPLVRSQFLHWIAVAAGYFVLLLFERTEIISREAAADVALVLLALGCFLAGVHFEWTFILLGIVLTVMAISMAYVEQYVVWLVMLPVAALAVWIFLLRHRRLRRD